MKGTLKVSGYIRGKPLSVNRLVHLPRIGDFQLKQVTIIVLFVCMFYFKYVRDYGSFCCI